MAAKQQSAAVRKGRRFTLIGLIVILVLLGVWLTSFLVHFDLNDYRKQVEAQLSAWLSLPVRVGNIRYNFHQTNLALQITDLEIGTADTALQVVAQDVLADLQWQALLGRELKFSRITLTTPQFWMRPAASAGGEDLSDTSVQDPITIDLALLSSISIRALELTGGTVHALVPDVSGQRTQLRVDDIEGSLNDIGLNQVCQFSLQGDLKFAESAGNSSWRLQGEASMEADNNQNLRPSFDLDVNISDLDLPQVKRFASKLPKAIALTGQSDLQLHLASSLNKALDFQGTLSSQNMTLVPGPWTTEPIPVRHVTASGRWHDDDQPQISNISLQWEDSHLAGQLAWAAEDQPFFIEANVTNSSLEVARLMPWLPQQGELWQTLRNRLQAQGTITIESAKVRVRPAASKHRWQIDHCRGELREAAWQEEALPLLTIASLPLQVADNRWQIDNGQASLGAMPIRLQGEGGYSSEGFTVTALDLDGASPLEQLQEEWQVPETNFLTSGTVAWKAHLEGPQDNLAVDFQADLGEVTIRHTDGLQLTAEPEDRLTLHGKITSDLLDLEHGSINLSALKGRLTGQYRYTDPASLTLDAMLSVEDLTRLADSLPALEPLHLRGQAELRLAQRGLPQNQPPEMTLTLRDAGFRPTRYIAALNNINGRIQVNPDGLQADNLQVHLGESPLTVTAKLDDYRNPRLALDVQGPSVRAQDIIFPAEQTAFRNLTGHLEIDADGLRFAPVNVHLDGGTDASITGTIRFHPPYGVDLDITSDFARISEVIALWTKRPKDPSESAEQATTSAPVAKSPRPRVRIKAQVAQGDLYGMAFHEASGLIQPTREHLLIFPLDFSVGTGSCNAQVLTEFGGDGPSRIRISGHAEDIDAFAVYRELLNQQSILRGQLSGDFYLQGNLGSQFFPTSYGQFNIQIRDGVLRQFNILSKVFSLLNVSQLFTLNLPDMDREGMPYQQLTGNLTLDQGVLKSDDLVIRSDAMNLSYIGQMDLTTKIIDLLLSVQPLGTVDKIVSRIPVAGWLLTGDDRALLTAHFSVKGDARDATVQVLPLDTLSEPTIGLIKRTLGLPMKLITDPHILWGGRKEESVEKPPK